MRDLADRARAVLADTPPRHLAALAAAMVTSATIVIVYAYAIEPNALAGDQSEYHQNGIFFTEGRWWWSELPYGIPHASAWKAPVYPAWMGLWYELLGPSPLRVAIVQGLLLAPLTVALTWLLGRHLFGATVAIWAAGVVAVFPLVWELFGLLYAESLAIPLTTLAILLFLARRPSGGLALATGAVLGVCLLVRPTSVFVFAGVLVAWILAAGWRRGLALTALAVAVAALVVAPWTIRNLVVLDGFVPISVQDGAVYGTFNEEAASDPEHPYAWRYRLADPPEVLTGPPVGEPELRRELHGEALDYIRDHPGSVAEAFFWNGLSRLWDIRRPSQALAETPFEGRSHTLGTIGLIAYWVMLPFALWGLWRARARTELWAPILAMVLAASVVFTVASGTRYRAPLEPLIVVLAVAGAAGIVARGRDRDDTEPGGAATITP
jgi:4-amino-4-deoxy-L-arabinose transferase-like glycosyltransferase